MGPPTLLLALVLGAAPATWAPGRPPFTVAIDPGHGGSNLGTTVGSIYEKRVTLELARRIRRRLAGEPGVKVVLCRESDVLVPIRARVRCANEAGARLFVSLHVNASPEGPKRGTQRGFELYVLPPGDVDEDATVAALGTPSDADAAWAAHQVRAAAEESALLARRIEVRLTDALGPAADRGIKQAGASLDVLRGVVAPAVLVEVGFLDHPEDGPLLTSADGLDAIASALSLAVTDMRSRDARGLAAMAAPLGPTARKP